MTTNIYDIRKIIRKVFRYGMVGGFSLIGNTLITFLISDIIKWQYIFSIIGILVFNLTIIFYLQKKFTFKNKEKNITKQFFGFAGILTLNLLIMSFFVPMLNIYFGRYGITTFVFLLILTVSNYIIQNFIFRNTKFHEKRNESNR